MRQLGTSYLIGLVLVVLFVAQSWAEEAQETATVPPLSDQAPETQKTNKIEDGDEEVVIEEAEVSDKEQGSSEKSEEAKTEEKKNAGDDVDDDDEDFKDPDDDLPPLPPYEEEKKIPQSELLKQFVLPGHKIEVVHRPEKCDRMSELGDRLGVAMTLYLENGTEIPLKAPKHFPLPFDLGAREVLPGIELSAVGMCVGERRLVVLPSYLAYGTIGYPSLGIPPNATLLMDMELVIILDGTGKRFFEALDRNEDGRLAKPEALRYLTRKQVWTKKDTAAAQYLHQKFVHEHKRVVAHFFEAFDSDSNGFLTRQEYGMALPAMHASRPSIPFFTDEEPPQDPNSPDSSQPNSEESHSQESMMDAAAAAAAAAGAQADKAMPDVPQHEHAHEEL